MSEFELQTLEQTAKLLKELLEERNALRARLDRIAHLSRQRGDPQRLLDAIAEVAVDDS